MRPTRRPRARVSRPWKTAPISSSLDRLASQRTRQLWTSIARSGQAVTTTSLGPTSALTHGRNPINSELYFCIFLIKVCCLVLNYILQLLIYDQKDFLSAAAWLSEGYEIMSESSPGLAMFLLFAEICSYSDFWRRSSNETSFFMCLGTGMLF